MNTQNLDQIISHLKEDLSKIKTGRATPALIEDLKVSAYGSMMNLKEVASISSPEALQLLVSPYDKNNKAMLKEIESALNKADLGCTAKPEGEQFRMIMPPLTAEAREKIATEVRQIGEAHKVQLREERHKFLNDLKTNMESKEQFEEGKSGADETIKKYTDQVDALVKDKEAEVMKI